MYLPQVRYLLLRSAKNAISCQFPPQREKVLSCGLSGKCTCVGERRGVGMWCTVVSEIFISLNTGCLPNQKWMGSW